MKNNGSMMNLVSGAVLLTAMSVAPVAAKPVNAIQPVAYATTSAKPTNEEATETSAQKAKEKAKANANASASHKTTRSPFKRLEAMFKGKKSKAPASSKAAYHKSAVSSGKAAPKTSVAASNKASMKAKTTSGKRAVAANKPESSKSLKAIQSKPSKTAAKPMHKAGHRMAAVNVKDRSVKRSGMMAGHKMNRHMAMASNSGRASLRTARLSFRRSAGRRAKRHASRKSSLRRRSGRIARHARLHRLSRKAHTRRHA